MADPSACGMPTAEVVARFCERCAMPIDPIPRDAGAGRRGAVAAAALLGLLVLTLALAAGTPVAHAGRAARPSFVVIQTDDQTAEELDSTWITPFGLRARTMPHTIDEIRRPGIEFSRYYVSYPLCCPSRASLLSGRYAHNTRVLGNLPPDGGFTAFQQSPNYRHNIATWLHRSGYRTIHLGKFLNNYGHSVPETTIPPGWDRWETLTPAGESAYYYGYHLNVDGRIEGPFGDPDYGLGVGEDDRRCSALPVPGLTCNYLTDSLTRRAVAQIRRAPGRQALLPPGRLHRPPRRPEAADRTRTGRTPQRLRAGHAATEAARVRRSRRLRQARLYPRPATVRLDLGAPDQDRVPQEHRGDARRRRRGRQADRRPAAERAPHRHLRTLHHGQRLLHRASTGSSAASPSPTSRRSICPC